MRPNYFLSRAPAVNWSWLGSAALALAAVAVLIPVGMGGLWRRKRLTMRARAAHDPFAHSQIQRRGRSSRSELTERRKEKRP